MILVLLLLKVKGKLLSLQIKMSFVSKTVYEMNDSLFSLVLFSWMASLFLSDAIYAPDNARHASTLSFFQQTVSNGKHHAKSCGRERHASHNLRSLKSLDSGRKNWYAAKPNEHKCKKKRKIEKNKHISAGLIL